MAEKRFLRKVARRLSRSVSEINSFFFCISHRNSRWPPKVAGKQFLQNVADRLHRYPADQKIRPNRSISLCFQDKHVFVFNAEIQDGHQKWRENNFCKMSPIDSTDTLRIKKFVQIALSRSVSKINVFSCLMQKFKMATKSGGKTIFPKSLQ